MLAIPATLIEALSNEYCRTIVGNNSLYETKTYSLTTPSLDMKTAAQSNCTRVRSLLPPIQCFRPLAIVKTILISGKLFLRQV